MNDRRRHRSGWLGLLRRDGRGKHRVPLRMGWLPPVCTVLECGQLFAGLLLALTDLAPQMGLGILRPQKFILAEGGIEQLLVGEKPPFLRQ